MSQILISKLVSGGQTGVDRAALDVGLVVGLAIGGWCPKGRLAENARIPAIYPLQETPSPHDVQRTAWNVRDTDGTFILTRSEPTGGTAFTISTAQRLHKLYLIIDLTMPPPADVVASWLLDNGISILNVAGPRERVCPGIYREAFDWLEKMLGQHAL